MNNNNHKQQQQQHQNNFKKSNTQPMNQYILCKEQEKNIPNTMCWQIDVWLVFDVHACCVSLSVIHTYDHGVQGTGTYWFGSTLLGSVLVGNSVDSNKWNKYIPNNLFENSIIISLQFLFYFFFFWFFTVLFLHQNVHFLHFIEVVLPNVSTWNIMIVTKSSYFFPFGMWNIPFQNT